MLIDSHCHLDFPEFAGDLDGILARAAAAGIGTMLTISTRLDRFPGVRAIAESSDRIWCSVGIHPHEASEAGEANAERLVALAQHPKVVGIGETGLDYFYENSPRAQQREVFRFHIEAARQSGLPIIIHTRDADDETAEILAEEMGKGAFTGLIHCFSSSRKVAEVGLELGLYISLSGIVTFNKAEALRDIVRDLPLDRILVETDSPFLAPVPHRGKRNEPAFTAATAAKVAELKGVGVDVLAAATTENFRRLFTKVTG
jgi:TatD DNase family protein